MKSASTSIFAFLLTMAAAAQATEIPTSNQVTASDPGAAGDIPVKIDAATLVADPAAEPVQIPGHVIVTEDALVDPRNQVIVARVPKQHCEMVTSTGSRIPKKRCFTDQEMEILRLEAQYMFRTLYDGTSNLTYGGGGTGL